MIEKKDKGILVEALQWTDIQMAYYLCQKGGKGIEYKNGYARNDYGI